MRKYGNIDLGNWCRFKKENNRKNNRKKEKRNKIINLYYFINERLNY